CLCGRADGGTFAPRGWRRRRRCRYRRWSRPPRARANARDRSGSRICTPGGPFGWRGSRKNARGKCARSTAQVINVTTPTARPARHGLTLVFTGNGKGKTTAAVGLTVRAAGNRMRVFFLQFIKGQWKTGEREILRNIPGVDLEVTGRGFTIERLRNPNIAMEDHAAAATHGWQVARTI